MEQNYPQAHKTLLKVVENIPPGDVKDEYNKLLGLIMKKIQGGT